MEIQVGSRVYSQKWDISGTVETAVSCSHPDFAGQEISDKEILIEDIEGFYHASDFELMQRNWRHVISLGPYGYIMWEVFEVMGEVNKFEDSYLECPDDTWLYVTCFHFFTSQRLVSYIDDTRDSAVHVITI